MQVIWGQVSHVTSPIISVWGEYWKCIFCNMNGIIWTVSDALNISAMHCWHVSLPYFTFSDVTEDVTGVILSHQGFSSKTSDQIAIELEGHHYVRTELTNRLMCDLSPLTQSLTLGRCLDLDFGINLDFDLYQTKVYIRRDLMRRLRWCLNVGLRPLRGVMGQNPHPDLWVIDLTSEVIDWHWHLKLGDQSLCLVMADMLVFCREALA